MNAVMALAPRKMTAEQYQAEKQQLLATYGENKSEANGLREQALAALYHRTGWTQNELAKVEGVSQQHVGRWLLFGAFLAFTPTGCNTQKPPRNLTERKFRSYWERTDKSDNDRQRFAAVARMIEDNLRVVEQRAPNPALATQVIDEFADGKWHKEATIKSHIDAPAEDIDAVLHKMHTRGSYHVHCDRRQSGKSHEYRIVKGGGKRVDVATLMQELRPLLDGLYAEGKKNAATFSGVAVATLAKRIENAIEQLAK